MTPEEILESASITEYCRESNLWRTKIYLAHGSTGWKAEGKKATSEKNLLASGDLSGEIQKGTGHHLRKGVTKIGVNWLVYTHTGEYFLNCININLFFESRALMSPIKILPAPNFYYPTLRSKSRGRFTWRHTVWDLSWGDRHMHLLIPDRQPTADQNKIAVTSTLMNQWIYWSYLQEYRWGFTSRNRDKNVSIGGNCFTTGYREATRINPVHLGPHSRTFYWMHQERSRASECVPISESYVSLLSINSWK